MNVRKRASNARNYLFLHVITHHHEQQMACFVASREVLQKHPTALRSSGAVRLGAVLARAHGAHGDSGSCECAARRATHRLLQRQCFGRRFRRGMLPR